MRLLYLDESGTDGRAEQMCVSGVLVHGDFQWPKVDVLMQAVIDRHIPESDREDFVFHANEIYHGHGYFDRELWRRDQRHAILDDLAGLINELSLPVVCGTYKKGQFKQAWADTGLSPRQKKLAMHQSAALDCLWRAEVWLNRYAPSELALVIHEDGPEAKKLIKATVKAAKSASALETLGLEGNLVAPYLPLKRIIDNVLFSGKPDARPLQLADLCAFILNRSFRGEDVPDKTREIIFRHMRWVLDPSSQRAIP